MHLKTLMQLWLVFVKLTQWKTMLRSGRHIRQNRKLHAKQSSVGSLYAVGAVSLSRSLGRSAGLLGGYALMASVSSVSSSSSSSSIMSAMRSQLCAMASSARQALQ